MNVIDLTDVQNLTSDLLAMIKLFPGNVAISFTKTIEVPLKNYYIYDEKIALGYFGDTSKKTSLRSMAKSFLTSKKSYLHCRSILCLDKIYSMEDTNRYPKI